MTDSGQTTDSVVNKSKNDFKLLSLNPLHFKNKGATKDSLQQCNKKQFLVSQRTLQSMVLQRAISFFFHRTLFHYKEHFVRISLTSVWLWADAVIERNCDMWHHMTVTRVNPPSVDTAEPDVSSVILLQINITECSAL